MDKIYICIDLKSFFASVECVERGLDPLNTNLVVADESRTDKTVCLAVTPSLKQYGIGGRARLYEVKQTVNKINNDRMKINRYKSFTGKSYLDNELKSNKNLELDFIIATPRMGKYIKYSTNIYNTYLKYVSKDDVFVYSIDEVFCDITPYLRSYKVSPRELVTRMIHDVYKETGITATAGIGTNLYLAKIAMDVVAKHASPDKYGVRIAGLTEKMYREQLWNFKPLTKFWRIGPGIAKKLEDNGMYTMGDVALMSIKNENLLYKLFGVNAELIIDHAWGYEPCTVESVKAYKPSSTSMSTGQVLHCPYDYKKTKIIVKEMADSLSLDLVKRRYKTNQLVLNIIYDTENLKDEDIMERYKGEIVTDYYGRSIPKASHGSTNLEYYSSSSKYIVEEVSKLYDKIINRDLLVRKINIAAVNLLNEEAANKKITSFQMDLFSNKTNIDKKQDEEKEINLQRTILDIKNKYGKNAILKGMNMLEGATMRDRNSQIGGHRE